MVPSSRFIEATDGPLFTSRVQKIDSDPNDNSTEVLVVFRMIHDSSAAIADPLFRQACDRRAACRAFDVTARVRLRSSQPVRRSHDAAWRFRDELS